MAVAVALVVPVPCAISFPAIPLAVRPVVVRSARALSSALVRPCRVAPAVSVAVAVPRAVSSATGALPVTAGRAGMAVLVSVVAATF